MRNPVTGKQCYGGMVPLDKLEEYEACDPVPPLDPIPPQRAGASRHAVREGIEESVE